MAAVPENAISVLPRGAHPVPTRRGVVLARLLGAMFTAMAAFQLADLAGFVGVLETFRLGGPAAGVLAVSLLVGELVSGLWLLIAPRRRPLVPAVVFGLVSVLWTALATQAFARGLVLDNCGCFGVYLAQPLRWWVLLQDAALLGYSVLLLRAATRASAGGAEPVAAAISPRASAATSSAAG
jgi:hypothetical protein